MHQQSQLEALSKGAGSRVVTHESLPGILLHWALFCIGGDDPVLRKSAYLLLSGVRKGFSLRVHTPLHECETLFVPQFSSTQILHLGTELGKWHPEFAFELLSECMESISNAGDNLSSATRPMSLMYLRPWVLAMARVLSRANIATLESGAGLPSAERDPQRPVQAGVEGDDLDPKTSIHLSYSEMVDFLFKILDVSMIITARAL
jgi:hypothetical protein